MVYTLQKFSVVLLFFLMSMTCYTQSSHTIKATLNVENHTINIQHELVFVNTTNDTLNEIYLHDWMHAYANKNTSLAKRFAEEFDKSLHLAKNEDRGNTKVLTMADKNFKFLKWNHVKNKDAIRVQLNFPIYPGKEQLIRLAYIVKIPSSKFTSYGFTENGNYHLKYWHVNPVVYKNKQWHFYDNKDQDDIYAIPSKYDVTFAYPKNLFAASDLEKNKVCG